MKQRVCIVLICKIFSFITMGCTTLYFGERRNILKSHGEKEIMIMDFSKPISLEPIESGWHHYKFFWHKPMKMEFVEKDNVLAIKITTNDTASMLSRYTEINLEEYPILCWKWYIEQPIESELDERTKQGDDHPARLFISFETLSGKKRNMEIVWGNKLKSGNYIYLDGFPHYVARGGNENIKKWFNEEINLLEIYRLIWKDKMSVNVINIGLFCDSDNTDSQSVSYFADIRMRNMKSTWDKHRLLNH